MKTEDEIIRKLQFLKDLKEKHLNRITRFDLPKGGVYTSTLKIKELIEEIPWYELILMSIKINGITPTKNYIEAELKKLDEERETNKELLREYKRLNKPGREFILEYHRKHK